MTDIASSTIAEELAKGLSITRNVNSAHLASFTIVYFDLLLAFSTEIKLIWKAEGVKMKVLYFLTRYLPAVYSPLILRYHFSDGHPDWECSTLYNAFGSIFTIAVICAALVATIRTWAVWAKAKYMTYVLFGTYTVASALIMAFFLTSLKYTSHQAVFNGITLGCIPKYESHYIPAAFVIEAAYDTVILALMLIRGVSLYRWSKGSRLFRTLYRDGIMFYVYITAVSIANAALLFSKPLQGNYYVFLMPMQGAIRSVLACRIVLHLRMSASQSVIGSQNCSYSLAHGERGGTEFCSVGEGVVFNVPLRDRHASNTPTHSVEAELYSSSDD